MAVGWINTSIYFRCVWVSVSRPGRIAVENCVVVIHGRIWIFHYIAHPEIDLWQRKNAGAGFDEFVG